MIGLGSYSDLHAASTYDALDESDGLLVELARVPWYWLCGVARVDKLWEKAVR